MCSTKYGIARIWQMWGWEKQDELWFQEFQPYILAAVGTVAYFLIICSVASFSIDLYVPLRREHRISDYGRVTVNTIEFYY